MLVINCLKRKDFGALNESQETSSRRLKKLKRRRRLLPRVMLGRSRTLRRKRDCLILLPQLSLRPKTKRSQNLRSNVAVVQAENHKRKSSPKSPRKQHPQRWKRQPSKKMMPPGQSQRAGLSARIATSPNHKHVHPKKEK
jgi:hypothetical protein